MNRRTALKRLGALTVAGTIAGCSSTDSPTDTSADQTTTQTKTATQTRTATRDLVLESWDPYYESEYDVGVSGIVANESGADYDYVQISFEFYTANDVKLGDALDNTSGLDAGKKWRFDAKYFGPTEDLDYVEFDELTGY